MEAAWTDRDETPITSHDGPVQLGCGAVRVIGWRGGLIGAWQVSMSDSVLTREATCGICGAGQHYLTWRLAGRVRVGGSGMGVNNASPGDCTQARAVGPAKTLPSRGRAIGTCDSSSRWGPGDSRWRPGGSWFWYRQGHPWRLQIWDAAAGRGRDRHGDRPSLHQRRAHVCHVQLYSFHIRDRS